MNPTETRSTKDLFRAWRSGDAQAGQVMAQRFADWYYAIATSRLGEERGRGPCEAACVRFGEGIVEVTESRALVGWAHEIVQGELASAGDRAPDGDEPNAYTGNQRPKGLLQRARAHCPEEVTLLEKFYSGSGETGSGESDEIAALAKPFGGMPLGVLKARYRVKQWLRDTCDIPFEVAPDDPVLDRAPMPVYESGRMNPPEEANFEQWMLTDLDLCKDIAEFAHFSIALRGGLGAADTRPTAPAPAVSVAATHDEGAGTAGKAALGGAALLGVGVLGVVVLLTLLLALYFVLT